jgi:hypothetical protein
MSDIFLMHYIPFAKLGLKCRIRDEFTPILTFPLKGEGIKRLDFSQWSK